MLNHNVEPPERRVVRSVRSFMEHSLPFVDKQGLDESQERRLALVCYAFGAIHSFVNAERLSAPQVHAIALRLFYELFQWPEEANVEAVQMAIEATAISEVREIMEIGLEAYADWASGDRDASRRLGELLQGVGEEDDEDDQ